VFFNPVEGRDRVIGALLVVDQVIDDLGIRSARLRPAGCARCAPRARQAS
jgi:hypothetical protein